MTIGWAALLGLVQGVTEFLPVSSSGHLVLLQSLFHLPEADLWFDVVLHAGSLVAIFWFFRRELGRLAHDVYDALRRGRWKETPPVIYLAGMASVPAFLIGFAGHDLVEKIFSAPKILPVCFAITGVLLWTAGRINKTNRPLTAMTVRDAWVIGWWQALAILPGVSRSGSTYTGGLRRGLQPEAAYFFAFLIAIPAIAGAMILELTKGAAIVINPSVGAGFMTAAAASLVGLAVFKKIIFRRQLHLLAYYCFGLSLVSLGIFWIAF